jgi:hypothetical protein|tara:strand:+ start:1185 stop:1739 length:555 start_codon:yes stop_codon:yes gene_type:complete
MPRNLNSNFVTALQSKNIKPVYLVNINFNTPIYFATSSFDIDFDGNTYSRNGFLLNISNINENAEITQNTVNINVSAVNQTYVSTILSENIINKQVKIHLGLLDNNNALVTGTYLLFDGRIKEFNINETENTSVINLSCASNFSDFDKIIGRKTNETSQQRFFLNDRGFQFAGVSTRDIKWGRA